ncbi:MAG TPA: hypothetical protein VNO31_46340 [Umezawaea sp.]|nr:hypothetical protein [Umezawaea sp.]
MDDDRVVTAVGVVGIALRPVPADFRSLGADATRSPRCVALWRAVLVNDLLGLAPVLSELRAAAPMGLALSVTWADALPVDVARVSPSAMIRISGKRIKNDRFTEQLLFVVVTAQCRRRRIGAER